MKACLFVALAAACLPALADPGFSLSGTVRDPQARAVAGAAVALFAAER